MIAITGRTTRSDGWWAVSFDTPNGTFHTQAKRLDLVPTMVHDILDMEGVDATVELIAVQSPAAVARLRAEGYSGRDIGALMGISAQRVSQLAP